MKIASFLRALALVLAVSTTALHAQVPQIINYQGRVAVGNPPVNFDGSGAFKFALVQGEGPTLLWKNDGSAGNTEPAAAVTLPVTKGLYSVLLGANMTAIPASVFANPDVRLRVWFNDGTNGSQLLTPDQRLAAVGYAMMAGNVQDGAITSAKIANGAVGSTQLAPGAVGNSQLATGAVISTNIAAGTVVPGIAVTGTSQTAVANTLYHANSGSPTEFALPATANVGDTIQVVGNGTGGWSTTASWTPRESSRNWRSVASSADGTKLVGVVYGGQIYTSTDSGVSWTPRESDRNWQSVASSADGTKLVAVDGVGFGRIYTSTDFGVSWTPRETNRLWRSVVSSADGTKLVAIVYSGQIYTSTDSGVSWTPRDANRFWCSVASSADGTKLVTVVDDGQIYTSTDSGVSWTPRESSRAWSSVASSADGTKLVAVLKPGQIYTSTDSGVSWTPRFPSRAWQSVASSTDGTKLVAVEYGGRIYTSTNSGVNWTLRDSDRAWQSVASSADGTKLVAVEDGGQIYTNLTGGQGTTATLQYQGPGEWAVLGSTGSTASLSGNLTAQNIPAGLIASSMITDATIVNADIAAAANIDATKLSNGIVTNPEFNCLTGVTSNLQTQLNAKLALSGGTLTGALTAPAYNLSTPVTRVLQISANAFVPDTQSEGYDRGAGLISPSGDTQLQFLANVHLPDSATVTKLVGVFSDGGTEDFTDIDVRMRYFSTSSLTAVIMAEFLNGNTIGQSGGRVEFEDTTITNAIIDNTARAYTVDATFTVDAATSNTRFYGVRIEYTVNSLTP